MSQNIYRLCEDCTKENLTIIIPVRIDSDQRSANVKAVLRHVASLGCRIIVLEADSQQKLDKETLTIGADYVFVKDKNPNFHRTAYINQMINMCNTDVIAVWDTDVLVDLKSVKESVLQVLHGVTISYPYNGEFVMLSELQSNQIRGRERLDILFESKMKPVFRRPFCGGVFLIHKNRYLKCGGENENFTGWGPEDAERLRRVRILGHEAKWITNRQAYHLWHPRGQNSTFFTKEDGVRLKLELAKISSMDKEELQTYISDEKWHITKI